VKSNLDEQQTKIYSVLKQKFEKYAEQQIAIALKVVKVCDIPLVPETSISDF
jgi:hypothetical protein